MMHLRTLGLLILMTIVLVACDRQAAEQPTTVATVVPIEEAVIVEPTAEPVVEPTAEPTEESVADKASEAAALPPEWAQLLNDWISPDSALCDAPGGVFIG